MLLPSMALESVRDDLKPRPLACTRFSRVRSERGSLSKVIDSLAAGYPFSIVHLLEFENRRRILFK